MRNVIIFVALFFGVAVSLIWGYLFYLVLSLFWSGISFWLAYLIMWIVCLVIGGLTLKNT